MIIGFFGWATILFGFACVVSLMYAAGKHIYNVLHEVEPQQEPTEHPTENTTA